MSEAFRHRLRVRLRFLGSAGFDDELDLAVRITRIGEASLGTSLQVERTGLSSSRARCAMTRQSSEVERNPPSAPCPPFNSGFLG
jgi:acyl-CoA thioesterase FadM